MARTGRSEWTLLSNHGHVLLCIARNPDSRLKDIAELVGITERATHQIVNDLEEAGFITRERIGRRNQYKVHPNRPMRHPVEKHHQVGELLRVLQPMAPSRSQPGRGAGAGAPKSSTSRSRPASR